MTDTKTFIDFEKVKETASLHQVMQMLKLDLKQSGGQFRGVCPVHGGSDRTLVVTPGKGFTCFAAKQPGVHVRKWGGDQIQLVAHVAQCGAREAAAKIVAYFGEPQPTVPHKAEAATVPQPSKAARKFNADAYLKGLDPAHEALKDLGISAEALKAWKAGYAKVGVNKGKLAIALCDQAGSVLGFCGRSLTDDTLTFPTGINPQEIVFGADKVKPGVLYVTRGDPLAVITAHENGTENVIALLSESISVTQLEVIIALMHSKNCESVELY